MLVKTGILSCMLRVESALAPDGTMSDKPDSTSYRQGLIRFGHFGRDSVHEGNQHGTSAIAQAVG